MTLLVDSECLHRYQLRPNCGANNREEVNVTAPEPLQDAGNALQ